MYMIRRAKIVDLAQIEACALAAYHPYIERIGRKPAPMVADFNALIVGGMVYVGTDDAGLVRGYVVYYPQADHVHLENVAVHPDCQGQGLGRQLIEWVEREAGVGGYHRIELYTNAKMSENLAVYPRLGYRQFDRRIEDGFDRIYFEKKLADH